MSDWTSESWKSKPVRHQPEYPDAKALAEATEELASFPPLVTSWEIEVLKQQLGEAATGHRFLLQGGDCAESFAECTSSVIINKLKILLQMSLVLVHGTHRRVIRVGRFAGQYAKPRSDPMETRDGVSMPSYYGDIVNRPAFESKGRMPDPWRMLRGYERSALTLNFIRSLIDGGFANGCMQLQLNVIDPKILIEARDNPGRHRGLLVRVSGYSAYFDDLSPAMQQEIIDRMTG